MRKRYFLLASFIILCIVYLFYRSCRRDTRVISPVNRIAIPDSSWLYGSVNLYQIRKDIAWSTLLNGDFNIFFQTDTTKNTFLKILRSPDDYAITDQRNIRYFSVWQDSLNYKGMLFALENDAALKQSFKSDSFMLKQQKVYSFRTGEGIWFYNSNNLLFVSGSSDSLAACRFFIATDRQNKAVHAPYEITADTMDIKYEEVLISAEINTSFIPAKMKNAWLDSTAMSVRVRRNDDMLDIAYVYKGFLTETLNESAVTNFNHKSAVFCTGNLDTHGIKKILKKNPAWQKYYLEHKSGIEPLLAAVDSNNFQIEFNGLKKIKSSYYTSVMNDEFEMVLQKKDSTIDEPVFRISLEQKNAVAAQVLLKHLQKYGLVSKGKQQPFHVIYGNFDSELTQDKNNTFIVHNKHTSQWIHTSGPEPLDAALLLIIQPSLFQNFSASDLPASLVFLKNITYKKIKMVSLHVTKQQTSLTGNMNIEFAGGNHPLIALMQLVKK